MRQSARRFPRRGSTSLALLTLAAIARIVNFMWWADLQTDLLFEWTKNIGPLLYVVAGLAAGLCAIWLILSWTYGSVVSSLRTRLKRAEERDWAFQRVFPGKTPADVAARIRQLEDRLASLPPRRLTDEQLDAITKSGSPPPSSSRLAIVHDSVSGEVGRYAHDLVEAYSATPGWNVVEEAYPMPRHALAHGVGVGLADPVRPTPAEILVLEALRDAGIDYELVSKITHGADAEIVVCAL
jgi:hypothetical protein